MCYRRSCGFLYIKIRFPRKKRRSLWRAKEGFNPVSDCGADAIATLLDGWETVFYRNRFFGEIEVDSADCTPFVKPSGKYFFSI